jgi:dipeptidase E
MVYLPIMKKRLLALSSSRVGSSAYLETARSPIHHLLGPSPLRVAFIPFANADNDDEAYGATVRQALADLPYTIETVTADRPEQVIATADAIMVGGGNTFKLLHDLYHYGLLELIKEKVNGGTPYIGWSAGANLTGLTIRTSNDMAIIYPPSFDAFGFFPFQLNPHYYNQPVEGFNGETRDQRLAEFLLLHPAATIVALPEGSALLWEKGQLVLTGHVDAVLFRKTQGGKVEKQLLVAGSDLSNLLLIP